MDESIFEEIKALLGPDADYDVFDQDILIHINSAIAVLTQLGVGPSSGFVVNDDGETWRDFLGSGRKFPLNMVKTYIYMKVKLAFDPPTNSTVLSAYQESCREFEWRMNVAAEELGS